MSMSDQLSSLFLQAVEIPTWDERQAFVDQRCEDDSELAADLMQMLRVHDKANGFLSQPPAVAVRTPATEGKLASEARIGRDSVLGRLTQEFELSSPPDNELCSPDGGQSTDVGKVELSPRYQLHGEIARGGMGAIVKAKDVDLGRTLAIKVLLDEHRDNPAIVERFIEEAQIGGQLQHPGITPVYELGAMPDRRPFFSMKLVKGQTLAALLKERKNPADQRSRLLGIFEQICQTMAYAHSRRVIHRDLKPANIMVGAFGEVQVMDWGLAKVLKTGGIADEKRARDTKLGQSLIQTVRSGSNHPQASIGTRKGLGSAGAETHAGSVMGTPAYMPPEQALGEIDRLDERCDVYGLGAILCEILTGAPPYVADDQQELFRRAAQGKLEECYQRLDSCGADQALIEIAKASIAPEVEDRLRNARELAEQITEYLESVESRLREAEVERAAEQTRVAETRKRNKVATALAASIVLMAALAGSGAIWFQVEADKRTQVATTQLAEVVNEVKLHRGLAESDNLTLRSNELKKAIASAEMAVGLFDDGELTDDQRPPVEELLTELKQAAKSVEAQLAQQGEDDKLRDRLEFMRLALAGDKTELNVSSELGVLESGQEKTKEKYTQIFLDAGIDIKQLSVAEAGKLVKQSSLSSELIAGLDQWSAMVAQPTMSRLISAATATGNWEIGIASSRQAIAAGEASGRFQAEPYIGLAAMLVLSGQHDDYRKLCQELVFEKPYPGGYVLAERVSKTCLLLPSEEMGVQLDDLPVEIFGKTLDEGRVAPSVAAYVWATRALAAYREKQFDDCVEFTERAEKAGYSPLSAALFLAARTMAQQRLDRKNEARESFAKLETLMDEIRSTAEYRRIHDALVAFLLYRETRQLLEPEGDLLEFAQWADPAPVQDDLSVISRPRFRAKLAGIASAADSEAWRTSVRDALMARDTATLIELADADDIQAQSPELAAWFAAELRREEKLAEAIKVLQVAYEIHPGDFWINYEMGRCLARQAENKEAIGFARAAVGLRPESAGARWSLCIALAGAGQDQESDLVFDRLLVDAKVGHENYPDLIDDLYDRGHYDKAKRIAEKWLDDFPNSSEAHTWMSSIYRMTEQFELSAEWAEKALGLNPKDSHATFNRAYSLAQLKLWAEAAEAYRAHLDLRPGSYASQNNLGLVLEKLEDFEGAEAAFREAIRIKPGYQLALHNLITTLKKNGSQPGLFVEIKTLTGQLAQADQAAIAALRQRLLLNPRATQARLRLASALQKNGNVKEAVKEAEKAIAFDPDNAETCAMLGSLCRRQGELDRAIEQYRAAVELDNEHLDYRQLLALTLVEKATGKKSRGWVALTSRTGSFVNEFGDLELTPVQEELVDEALEHLQFARPQNSANPLSGAVYAELLRLRGRDAEADAAEQAAEEALASFATQRSEAGQTLLYSPTKNQAGVNRLRGKVNALREAGRIDEALEAIDEFFEKSPESVSHPVLLSLRASLYIDKGEDDKGIAIFQDMLDGDAQLQGYLGLARYHTDQGNLQEAVKFYRDGIQAFSGTEDGPSPLLYSGLAEVYARQDRPEQELAIYELILDADQSPVHVLMAIHRKFEIDGDLAAALERHAKWRFSGGFPPSLGLWAWLLVVAPDDQGDFADLDTALGYARDAANRQLQIPRFFRSPLDDYFRRRDGAQWIYSGKNTLGIVHFRRREYQQALTALQEFYEMGFEEPSNWLFLAMTHWKLDNEEEARKWLKKATEYLDQEDYRIRHSEKLFRAEAEKLINGNEGGSDE